MPATSPFLDATNTTEPPVPCWRSRRNGLARDQEVAVPRIAWLRFQSASVVSSIARAGGDAGVRDHDVEAAEALDRRARRPRDAASLVTSPCDRQPGRPEVGDRGLAPSPSRSKAITAAPSAASASTIARPMPPAAPVTRAIRPCSSRGGGASESL